MVLIKSTKANFAVNLPSSVKDITPEMLDSVTAGVSVPKHYCIVAQVLETTLFKFTSSVDTNDIDVFTLTPLLAKISAEDAELKSTKVGSKLIIYPSSLERGAQVDLPTMSLFKKIRKYLKEDETLKREILTNKYTPDGTTVLPNDSTIAVMEFKIVPVGDINATVISDEIHDPFIVEDREEISIKEEGN